MTENVYRGVVFDGVCTDLSNAAYPVEEVRRCLEPEFGRYENVAIHLALTLIHHGLVEDSENKGFELSDEGNRLAEDDELFERFCEHADVRPETERDLARFASFFEDVVEAVT